jgi:hypothetical protein
MAFEKGHQKIGGRQKGMPNKKTIIKADEILLDLNVNPIQRLIELAESKETTIDQKISCYKEVAKYTYPKFKSQELRVIPTEPVGPIEIRLVEANGKTTIL